MILYLQYLSRDLNVESALIFQSDKTQLSWISLPSKGCTLNEMVSIITKKDLLIIPEVLTHFPLIDIIDCRKVVFVQGGFLIPGALGRNDSFQSMKFECALVVMDHLKRIIMDFWPIDTHIISPIIADYFFTRDLGSVRDRKKQILLYPKKDYQEAGYYDYNIIKGILTKWTRGTEWKLINLEGLPHKKVASLMKESSFFVNTNCFESLNASVAEAMASGCVVFCYEAYGGQDYLENGVNAFVYPNNYIFPMLRDLRDQIFEPDDLELDQMRLKASETVQKFNGRITRHELKVFLKEMDVLRE